MGSPRAELIIPRRAQYSEPVILRKSGGEEANRDRQLRASSRREPCLSSFGRVPNDALGSRPREVPQYDHAEDHHLFQIITMQSGITPAFSLIAYTYRGYPKSQYTTTDQNKPKTGNETRSESDGGRGKKGDATPKRNHVNLPASPSDGASANEALGSSRHTRSRGIVSASRDFINDSTPCVWHSAWA